jgi:hypothetical protein
MPVVDVIKPPNENGTRNPISEGRYDLRIMHTEIGESKSGTPYLRAVTEVVASDSGMYVGMKPSLFISLTEKMTWLLISLLKASGVSYEEAQTPEGVAVRFDTDDLVGCYVNAGCKHHEYQDQIREQWGNYKPSALENAPSANPTAIHNTHGDQAGEKPAPPLAVPHG